jgi:DNA-binding HxlR family transcriptional regulator
VPRAGDAVPAPGSSGIPGQGSGQDWWRQVTQILAAVNGKWTATILRHLGDRGDAGARPSILLAAINEEAAAAGDRLLSNKIMLACLDRLVGKGLVTRTEVRRQPPRETLYRLTAEGEHILKALCQMAAKPW